MSKKNSSFKIALVFGVILLFIGIGIQPAFADISIGSDDSELVEITVQFYEKDKTYNHTVMLSKKQAQELEYLKENFKAQIDSTDNTIETENVYKNAVVSINKLGLLPEDMSIDYAQNLVINREHNSWLRGVFEKLNNKKKGFYGEYENILCLIAGDSDKTSFAGPVPILMLLHFVIIMVRINAILDWVASTSKIGELVSNIFKEVFREVYQLRLLFWLFLGAGINFFPLKIGSFIFYGSYDVDPFYGGIIPSEGWVSTIGLYGKKSCYGSFWGLAIGFTGIKIFNDYFDFFYFGTALDAMILEEY